MFTQTNSSLKFRPASTVMRLARIGSFHQSRLSFMRVLLRRLQDEAWTFDIPLWRIDKEGVGVATYRAIGPKRTYTLVAFSHNLPAEKRSDRVIAEAWDCTFTLFDGEPSEQDIERLSKNVPLQEAGRVSETELSLSRANRSVRLFDYVVDCLAKGEQPSLDEIQPIGYLMRTTAVYGSSKFGSADRNTWCNREEFAGSFQPELLLVWLVRAFTIKLVEHLASMRSPQTATTFAPEIKRYLGIGNSTGLGMAPFLMTHPSLLHSWINARETALAQIRAIENPKDEHIQIFSARLDNVIKNLKYWQVDDNRQTQKIKQLHSDLQTTKKHLTSSEILKNPNLWDKLYLWAESNLALEAQEQLVSLFIEPYGELIDDLAMTMSADESKYFHIDGKMLLSELKSLLQKKYAWALKIDFSKKDAIARAWYVSEEKLEPRLGERFEESIDKYEQPLSPARDISIAFQALQSYPEKMSVADFLLACPEHRYAVRRVQTTANLPYAEIYDNTISAEMLPLDLLRCKLSFFGATRFDPKSDRWLRITMFQGAPFPEELQQRNLDDYIYITE
jgi:hypothetical protein